ncbi:spirocyclase AveC family protein [Mycobacterium avium]|uniref:spirocyclase AveC family protein n=1 Tax=Mycobacterium avium TaxID=1764 RepID=UPI0009FD6E20|nr:spirocyclase AveC family protein [Mycobacterium avium]
MVAWASIAILLCVVVYNARTGAVSDRIRNPAIIGAPRPAHYPFGWTNWVTILQVGTLIAMILLVVGVAYAWHRQPRRPVLLMVASATGIVWWDPLVNWAPYAVYNPELWHWPEDWPLFSIAPVVEPFIVIGYAFFYVGPYFPAVWILRRIQERRPVDSFVWRHPLISMGALIFLIGFVFDAWLEISCIRTGLYIYSQVIPFGSVFTGTVFQFPLLWESTLVTVVMIPAGVLLYRDDTGRTVAEKLAQRARIFPSRPALGTFLLMFAILNVSYLGYFTAFGLIRDTRVATSMACPWPYPEAKVYDPQGFYEKNGQPGPYSAGIWSTWMSAQPHGRPDVVREEGGRCSPGRA